AAKRVYGAVLPQHWAFVGGRETCRPLPSPAAGASSSGAAWALVGRGAVGVAWYRTSAEPSGIFGELPPRARARNAKKPRSARGQPGRGVVPGATRREALSCAISEQQRKLEQEPLPIRGELRRRLDQVAEALLPVRALRVEHGPRG